MLLWLEGGAEVVASVCARGDRVHALRNILASVRRGENAFFADRALLHGLCDSGVLDESDSACLRSAAQDLTQFGSALAAIKKIRLSTTASEAEKSGQEWIVPIERFLQPTILYRPLLIGESMRDARFLLVASQRVLDCIAPGFVCSFIPSNGGGDSTAEVLEEYLRSDGPPFFCVVDSDQEFQFSNFGQTASKCQRAMHRARDEWCFRLYVLEARELENLLPVALRESLLEGMSGAHLDAHKRLREMPDSVSLYVCLKEGEHLCRFYAKNLLERRRAPPAGCYCHDCHETTMCESIPPFGRLLVRSLDFLANGRAELPPPDQWPAPLRTVCQELSQYSIARRPFRV